MKRILVPCDFSKHAIQALKFAIRLANRSGGEVFVLNVIDLPILYETTFGVQPNFITVDLVTEFKERAWKKFNKIRNTQKGVKVSFEVQNGPVSPMIRQYITSKKIDLVVMGTLGASGWKEYLVGSNTEKIVRFSPVPVIAVPGASPGSSIKNIVLPATLHLDQSEFMKEVKALQEFFKAKLQILFLNTPMNFKRDAESKALLNDFTKHYSLKNYTLNVRNEAFEADGIINFASEIKADMVAMATHSYRGLMHVMTGSIAEDVVNHINIPIWTYTTRKKGRRTK